MIGASPTVQAGKAAIGAVQQEPREFGLVADGRSRARGKFEVGLEVLSALGKPRLEPGVDVAPCCLPRLHAELVAQAAQYARSGSRSPGGSWTFIGDQQLDQVPKHAADGLPMLALFNCAGDAGFYARMIIGDDATIALPKVSCRDEEIDQRREAAFERDVAIGETILDFAKNPARNLVTGD